MTQLVDLYLVFDLFIRINNIKRVKIINKLYMGLNSLNIYNYFHPFYVFYILCLDYTFEHPTLYHLLD